MQKRSTCMIVGSLVAVASLLGCGGGSRAPSSGRGSVRVTILWPASRLIPPETRSIKLKAQILEPDDGEFANELVIPRPEGLAVSTSTIENVPSVRVRIVATAHGSLDGSGSVLATGSSEVRVLENGTIPVSIELNGAAPNPLVVTPDKAAVRLGDSVQFLASEPVTWSVSGGGAISSSGRFTASEEGQFTVFAATVAGPARTQQATVRVSQLPVFMSAQVPFVGGLPQGTFTRTDSGPGGSTTLTRKAMHRFHNEGGFGLRFEITTSDENGSVIDRQNFPVPSFTDSSFTMLGFSSLTVTVNYDPLLGGNLNVDATIDNPTFQTTTNLSYSASLLPVL